MSDILLVKSPITHAQLSKIAGELFGDMVKAVVDIEQKILAVGGELHADEEAFLLDRGSKQKNLWGINIYPDLKMPDMLEYDSMINIRPSQNNPSRTVASPEIRKTISAIVKALIKN